MNAERWREVKAVLHQVISASQSERDAIVDAACQGNVELRRDVDALLQAHDAEEAAVDPLRDTLETALGAQYDILRLLGAGGMGSVFLARERALDRTVAIKVLRPDRATTPGTRERFRREARIVAQLSHAGIVPLHSFGEVNGLWYFVMEYVRGPSLAQRLDLEGRLPADDVRSILLAIADAVEYAHQHGVIHRDIKPGNILLDEIAGRPRLADFGISKVEGSMDDITATGAIMGTPHFMSPEQADGTADIDGRSDIYSLGAVAYMMLTGQPPHPGDDVQGVIARRRLEDPLPIADLVPRLPVELGSVIMRCLARERGARWRDVTAFRNALRNSGSMYLPELPEAIADLPGYAAYALVWMVLWTLVAFASPRSSSGRALLMLVAVLVPVGPALHIWRVRAHGLRASQLLRLVLRPPRWWAIWWPARLRRPDDLWPLLPRVGRAVRISITAFFALLLTIAIAFDAPGSAASYVRNVAAGLLLAWAPIAIVYTVRWARRSRLTLEQTVQFFFSSTTPSPFWDEPVVTRLLAPTARLIRPPDPGLATDYVRAVEQLTARFPGSFTRLREPAVRAAQHCCAEIAALEREIGALDRDASAPEVDRLTARISQLMRQGTESAEHRELYESMSRQLEVLTRMQGRKTMAATRRAEQFALLRALWAQLTLRLEAERDGGPSAITAEQRVTDLCRRMIAVDVDVMPTDRNPSVN